MEDPPGIATGEKQTPGNLASIPASEHIDYTKQISETSVDGTLKIPHVLISLALEENKQLPIGACSRWLASFPTLAKYATVESVFKSHSTLLLVSLPVMIWDLLPDNPACSFIGYVNCHNMLSNSTSPDIAAAIESEKAKLALNSGQRRK